MHSSRALRVGFATCICVCASLFPDATRAQTTPLDTAALTYGYEGIGGITWPKSPRLHAVIAPPHFSAGPTIRCPEYIHKCEIDVVLRDLTYYTRSNDELFAEIEEQLSDLQITLPPNANVRKTASAMKLEFRFDDQRPTAKYRFTTLALVFKGPATMQIVAQSNDSTSNADVVALATGAKAISLRENMGYRFGQYVRACTERMPATKASNESALEASPFNESYVFENFRQRDSTVTPDKIKTLRAERLPSFLKSLDGLSADKRESFCKRLPTIIKDAVAEMASM